MVTPCSMFMLSMLSCPIYAEPFHDFLLREPLETPTRLSARDRGAQRALDGPTWPFLGWPKASSALQGLDASRYAEQIGSYDENSTTNIIFNGITNHTYTHLDGIPADLHSVSQKQFVGLWQMSEQQIRELPICVLSMHVTVISAAFLVSGSIFTILLIYEVATALISNMLLWLAATAWSSLFLIPLMYCGARKIVDMNRYRINRNKIYYVDNETITLALAIPMGAALVAVADMANAGVPCAIVEATLLLVAYVGLISVFTGPIAFGTHEIQQPRHRSRHGSSGDEIFGICPPLPRLWRSERPITTSSDAQVTFAFAETILLPILYLIGLILSFLSIVMSTIQYLYSSKPGQILIYLTSCVVGDAIWLAGIVAQLAGLAVFGLSLVPQPSRTAPARPLLRQVKAMIIQDQWRRYSASKFPDRPAETYVVDYTGAAWPTQRVFLRGTPFYYLSSVFQPMQRRYHTWRDGLPPSAPDVLFSHHQRDRSCLGFQPRGCRVGATQHRLIETKPPIATVRCSTSAIETSDIQLSRIRPRSANVMAPLRHCLWLLLLFTQLDLGAADDPSTSRPPVFSGNRIDWTAHVIAFFGWLAWKQTDCTALVEDPPEKKPEVPGMDVSADGDLLNADEIEEKTALLDDYHKRNKRLYGAILMSMPSYLATSLHLYARNDGQKAWARLVKQFDATNENDLAAAIARVGGKYIDSKADLNEDDLNHQFDAMQVANAEVIRAGGDAVQDRVLMVMFDNALPPAYSHIRQMVRRVGHTDFINHVGDYLSMVRAEIDARASHQPAHAFSAPFIPQGPGGSGGGGKGGGKGGGGRGGGRGRGRGRGNPSADGGSGTQNVRCLRCLEMGHGIRTCTKAPQQCPHCRNHADHHPSVCPHGPGGAIRDGLSFGARRRLATEAGGPVANGQTAQPQQPATQSAQQPQISPQMMRQFAAAMAAMQSSTPPPMPPPTAQPAAPAHASARDDQQPAADSQGDEVAAAYAAALRARGYAAVVRRDDWEPPPPGDDREREQIEWATDLTRAHAFMAPPTGMLAGYTTPSVPPELRWMCPSAQMSMMYVDSMATYFILRRAPPGFRVTNSAPGFSVDQLSGSAKVQAVGDAWLYLEKRCKDGTTEWTPHFVRGILIIPDAEAELYATRSMRDQHNAVHHFEAPTRIVFSDGDVPFSDDGSAFVLTAAWGGPPRGKPQAKAGHTVALTMNAAVPSNAVLDEASGSVTPPPASQPAAHGSVTQTLLWQRLGFPHEEAWRHVTSVTSNHGQPQNAILSTTLAARDAVMRGRARALPFMHKQPIDRTMPPPGAVIYMDYAGPLVKSHPHRFTGYSGVICAGSGYGRMYPTHKMTAEVAKASFASFVADLTDKMGLSVMIKPRVVVSDQGSYYMAVNFREFLADGQVAHRPATVYTPQQNAIAERMFGVTFSTTRVLLAAANLPPSFHPFAVQTARWIHNRLPQHNRGNMSPYTMLSRKPADVSYLRAFGCLVEYYVPRQRRVGDSHFADRGASGMYLGPSEESPGSVIYVPSNRTVFVTRSFECFEDRFPGIRGETYNWFPVTGEEGVAAPNVTPQCAQNVQNGQSSTPPTAPPPQDVSAQHRHDTIDQTPLLTPQRHPALASPQSRIPTAPGSTPARQIATQPSGQEGVVPTFRLPSIEEMSVVQHPDADKPSSVQFQREHPQRERRQPDRLDPTQTPAQPATQRMFPASDYTPGGGYREGSDAERNAINKAKERIYRMRHERGDPIPSPWKKHLGLPAYINPTQCDLNAARRNFCMVVLAMTSHTVQVPPTPAFAYALESTVDVSEFAESGVQFAMRADVRETADYGDVPIPRSYRQAIESSHSSYWKAAIAKEIDGLVSLRTWTAVPLSSIPARANVMRCHFVFEVKRKQDGSVEKFKARLVADGNTQQHGVDFDRVFSTVVKMSTVRLVLAIAATRDYNLTSVDIRQAYLQAELSEDLYMRVPAGLPDRDSSGSPLVLKLNRSLYGLKQAGREWNKLLVAFLLEWGFKQSSIDVCLFTYTVGTAILWLLVWVDDIIQVDNDSALRERFTSELSKRFPTEDKGVLEWVIGVHVKRDRESRRLELSQELYVSDLLSRHSELLGSGHGRRYTSPMDSSIKLTADLCPEPGSPEAEKMAQLRHTYMSIVGGVLWLANVTRFELSYAASQLARFVSNPGELHFAAAVRVLLYLQHSASRTLVYHVPRHQSKMRPLEIYVDSDWSVKFSSSGALFFFNGCLVAWFSKVQRSVSFSSAESEIFGAILAAKEGIFFRELLTDLGLVPEGPTRIFSDSKSCVDLSFDPIAFKKTKHILRAAEGLRDYVARLVYVMIFLTGSANIADILTKPQATSVFVELMGAYDAYVSP